MIAIERMVQKIYPGKWAELTEIDKRYDEIELGCLEEETQPPLSFSGRYWTARQSFLTTNDLQYNAARTNVVRAAAFNKNDTWSATRLRARSQPPVLYLNGSSK
jgi:hypothetical protein